MNNISNTKVKASKVEHKRIADKMQQVIGGWII
jgi:hypothetical protein